MSTNVISFHYTLKDKQGKTIESSKGGDPIYYMEGSGQIIPGLEKALTGMKGGDKKTVSLEAADAYGKHDKSLIVKVPRNQLPDNDKIEVGAHFRSESPDGQSKVFFVTGFTDTHVDLDGNHPWADQDLTFDVEIVEIRKATEEEMTHGHAHGPGGHHHH
jgi:FKBP-type peptidyl-prolyl cis-trans isomerase SlyD